MPPSKPPGGRDDLASAIAEVKRSQDQRSKQAKRKTSGRQRAATAGVYARDWIKKIITLVVVVLLILLIDGLRRESADFKAVVSATQGDVRITSEGQSAAAQVKQKLRDADFVETGANGSCTLVLGDGSALEVEPNSRLGVRVLDYTRNGRRDRSFMLEQGSVVSVVGKYFGAESTSNVVTPTAVAAVRGTAFRVLYNPANRQSTVQTAEGTVETRTPASNVQQVGPGQMAMAVGYGMTGGGGVDGTSRATMANVVTRLTTLQADKEPTGLTTFETAMTSLADPVLQLLGICPGGWGYGSMDAARRTACLKALQTLQTHMAELPATPDVLNLWTLAELQLNENEKNRLIKTFQGFMLDSYQKNGSNWEIRATARDKRRTKYICNEGSVRKAEQ